MSFSRSIINEMHISAFLAYLKNANDSLTLLLEDPLRPVITYIMTLRNELETLDAKTLLLEQTNPLSSGDLGVSDLAALSKMNELKKVLINLLDNDFENKFVEKLRLDLNDYIITSPSVLTTYAKNKLKNLRKLGHVEPDIVFQANLANDLAIQAEEMINSLDSFDPASTSWTMDVDRYENMVKQDIAQASAIFHDIDKYEYMHNLSKNKAGKIIKRRIRRTKRRSRNNRNSRNSRKYRKYRNSTRRTQ